MINKLLHKAPKVGIRWQLVMPVIILIIISLMTLNSTSKDVEFFTSTFYKQMIWIGGGCFVFLIIQYFKIRFFYEYAYVALGLFIIAVILTYAMPAISGAHRWLKFGPFSFQPSEIGKVLLIFAIAKFLTDKIDLYDKRFILIVTLSMVGIPALLVFNQPDLGTAIIYVAVAFPMLYWAGVRPFYLFTIVAPFISIAAAYQLKYFYIWILILLIILFISQPKLWVGIIIMAINVGFGTLFSLIKDNLYPHQIQRIVTFFQPLSDPHGAGYQIIQSVTAIGSGGLTGKGLKEGTQTHLRFLPVRDTDFIISVVGEEMGLVGILAIIVSFFFLTYWLITYAEKVSNKFASLSLIGFSSLLFIHIIVNMGMTVGLFPVTGLPAPFISYGGSFLTTCLVVIAISNNIALNDF